MIIHNEVYAQKCLIKYNYYRLSAYWHIFRLPDSSKPNGKLSRFKQNTTFELTVQLYEFDKNLRELVFQAITEVETYFRTQIAFLLPQMGTGAFAIYDSRLFQNKSGYYYSDLLKRVDADVDRAKKEDFVKHYMGTYHYSNTANGQPKLPIWMLTEVLSFGTLKAIYSNLLASNKKTVVKSFNIYDTTNAKRPKTYAELNFKELDSLLFFINKYRNICAHHGRLWNRQIKSSLKRDTVQTLGLDTSHTDGGLYALLIVLARLLEPTGRAKDWKDNVYSLIESAFPLRDADNKSLVTSFTTLPQDWYEHPVWR